MTVDLRRIAVSHDPTNEIALTPSQFIKDQAFDITEAIQGLLDLLREAVVEAVTGSIGGLGQLAQFFVNLDKFLGIDFNDPDFDLGTAIIDFITNRLLPSGLMDFIGQLELTQALNNLVDQIVSTISGGAVGGGLANLEAWFQTNVIDAIQNIDLSGVIGQIVEAITGQQGTLQDLTAWIQANLTDSVAALWAEIQDLLARIVEAITGARGPLTDITNWLNVNVLDQILSLGINLDKLLADIVEAITGGVGGITDLRDWFRINVIDAIANIDLSGVIDQIVQAITGNSGTLQDLTNWIAQNVTNATQALSDLIQQLVDTIFQAVGGTGTGHSFASLKAMLESLASNANTALADAATALAQLANKLGVTAWNDFLTAIFGTTTITGATKLAQDKIAGLVTDLAGIKANADQAIANFQAALTKFGVPDITAWLNDLFSTKGVAATASGNANTALVDAQQALANFQIALNKFGVGSVSAWLDDLFGTKGIASTANTKADEAKGLIAGWQKLGGNILPNGNFENTSYYTGNGTYETSVKRSGSRSCSLTGNGARLNLTTGFNTNDPFTNSVPCRPSSTFYVEGWVYGAPTNTGGGSIQIYIDDYNADGVMQPQQYNGHAATTAMRGVWTKVSAKITVSAVAASTYIFVYMAGQPAGDKYYFDNFVAYEVTEATAAQTLANAAQSVANTALTDAQQALTNFQAALTKFGVGSVTAWLDDLFGTKSTASAANAKAVAMQNALDSAIGSGNNICANPSFEDTGFPQASAAATYSTEMRRSGSRSMKLTGITGQNIDTYYFGNTSTYNVWLPVQEGDVFYFEAWIKGGTGNTKTNGAIRPYLRSGDPAAPTTSYPTNIAVYTGDLATLNAGWNKLSGFYTVPAGGVALQVAVQLHTSAGDGCIIHVDDLACYRITEAYNAQLTGNAAQASANTALADAQKAISDAAAIVLKLFGGATMGTSILESLVPALTAGKIPQLDQSKITNLVTDLSNKLASSSFNTFLTNVFGTTTVTGSTTLAQSKIANLVTDLAGIKANADQAIANFAAALAKFGAADITAWLNDLFSTKGTASAANANANTALSDASAANALATLVKRLTLGGIYRGDNIVSNVGFEQPGFYGQTVSSEYARTGTYSAKHTHNGSAYGIIDLLCTDTGRVAMPVQPGDVFVCEGWIYGHPNNVDTNGLVWFQFQYLKTDGTTVNQTGTGPNTYIGDTAKGVWTKFTKTLTMPADAKSIACMWVVTSNTIPANNIYYVDDVTIYRTTEATAAQTLASAAQSAANTAATNAQQALTDAAAIVTKLFGGSTMGSSILESLVPVLTTGKIPTLDQSKITGLSTALTTLTNDVAARLTAANFNTFLTNVFGTTTVDGSTTIAQSKITGLATQLTTLANDIAARLTAANFNTFLTNVFGTTNVTNATTIAQSKVANLATDLAALLKLTDWNTFLTNIFGTTTVTSGTTIAQAKISGLVTDLSTITTNIANKLGITDWNTFLNNIFGTTNVTGTTTIAQSKITGLVDALAAAAKQVISQILPGWLPQVPVSSLTTVDPNLLWNPGFTDAVSIDSTNTDFTYDSTIGRTTPLGSAKVTFNGTNRRPLWSNSIPTVAGDKLTVSGYIRWSSVTASGGSALDMVIAAYNSSDAVISETVVASGGTTGTQATWQKLTGVYTVPANCTYVAMGWKPRSFASVGTGWVDDCEVVKSTSWGTDLGAKIANLNLSGLFDASKLTNILNIPIIDASRVLGPEGTVTVMFQNAFAELAARLFGGLPADVDNPTLGNAAQGLQNIWQKILDLTGQVRDLQTPTTGGSSSVNFANYGNGALPTNEFDVTYAGAGTGVVGNSNGAVQFLSGNNAYRQARVRYVYQKSTGDNVSLRATLKDLPQVGQGGQPDPKIWGVARLSNDWLHFVFIRGYCTGFLTYKCDIGCYVNGVETIFQQGIGLDWNTQITLNFGVAGNPRRYQGFSGSKLIIDYTESGAVSTLPSVQSVPANFRSFGAILECQAGNSAARYPGSLSGFSAVNT